MWQQKEVGDSTGLFLLRKTGVQLYLFSNNKLQKSFIMNHPT